ncbi:MAG: dihydroorotate dehydrogenase electron transfer subunit [Ignavibacteriae bacterium]|nr:dihydroorotate dehydrogenase electron transfer subunit [Ignavibacteriota bacterium]
MTFVSEAISSSVLAGQFINIKIDASNDPLLRRPFSVYRTNGPEVEIIFNVIGKGSSILHRKREGDTVGVLGPLGVPFSLSGGDFTTALLIGGGLGVAPLPISTAVLRKAGKSILTFLGSRTANQLVGNHLESLHVATDDGTAGFHGTVVDLFKKHYRETHPSHPKIFACGPTRMLHAVAEFAMAEDIPCEVSMEGPMACGFGICQGCPVELVDGDKKYALMCKDGPTFDVRRIRI